jgi:hypothetical protein
MTNPQSLIPNPLMRFWRFWFSTFMLSSQYNPPRFVEMVMVLVAIALLMIWQITLELPYMILGWSLVVGASMSILVREAIAPTPETFINRLSAFLFLIISGFGFLYIFQTL